MYRILVAEDDLDIIKILTLYLENSGMEVVPAFNGQEALDILSQQKIDLVLLDIMMPVLDGYATTRAIRQARNNIPIIILSAKVADENKILGLDMGADDYMTKPFNPLEVVARVKCNLRRFYDLNEDEKDKPDATIVEAGKLRLNLSNCTLEKDGELIPLTSTEYKIMQLFMQNPGRIYTKVQIYENTIGEYFGNDENTIMVHISRLRDKIEEDVKNPIYIKTVRGLGYKFER